MRETTPIQQPGAGLDIIDRCQNHVLPGSKVRWYHMHHDCAEENRAAWLGWAHAIRRPFTPRLAHEERSWASKTNWKTRNDFSHCYSKAEITFMYVTIDDNLRLREE